MHVFCSNMYTYVRNMDLRELDKVTREIDRKNSIKERMEATRCREGACESLTGKHATH